MPRSLDLLFLTLFPPSPPTFGAQRRIDGLLRALARRHRVSLLSLLPAGFDGPAAERALRGVCDEVVLVPWEYGAGPAKRFAQLRSLASTRSFERLAMNTPALQRALDRLLRARAFDAISVEAPFLAFSRLRQAPPGEPPPRILIDAHNVEHDLARQSGDAAEGVLRRAHHAANWRKLRRDEIAAWRLGDGVAFTSADDAARARALAPALAATVVPNAVDVAQFAPRPDLPAGDGRTLVFFGTLDYFPNQDGVRWFLREIWPRLSERAPRARFKIIGPHPTAEVLAQAGARVEVAGLVEDLPRHLAEAAAVVVPLRVGGGTRFKILEAMAMAKPVLSTRLGAEGIEAAHGQELLLADDPESFAATAARLLDDAPLAARLGAAGRSLVERRYSWDAAAAQLEAFLRERLGERPVGRARPAREVTA